MANEKRLIDVEQAKKATYEEIFWTESAQASVRNFLAGLPKVDAAEVVRCKDCDNLCPCGNDSYICSSWGSWTDLEGWCHKGERKTDG